MKDGQVETEANVDEMTEEEKEEHDKQIQEKKKNLQDGY